MADPPRDVPPAVPVIDTGNTCPGMRDPQVPEVDAGTPGCRKASGPPAGSAAPVMKAFKAITVASLAANGRPEGSLGRHSIAVAGDDPAAKRIAMDLVNGPGFGPVDAGSLEEPWRRQPLTPAYCCDCDAATTRRGLAAAVRGEAPKDGPVVRPHQGPGAEPRPGRRHRRETLAAPAGLAADPGEPGAARPVALGAA